MGLGILAVAATVVTAAASATDLSSLYSHLVADGGVRVDQGLAYGAHARQRLDVYHADEDTGGRPVAIFMYGGSWQSGDRATYGFVGAALASRGITTVIPDYRLFPEVRFPLFMDDVAAAYRWVDATFTAAGGARRPIVLIGHSAGAHMAALLAFDPKYLDRAGPALPRPAGLVGLAGPYAFDPTTWPSTADVFADTAANPDAARPITFVRPGAPPALLMHGLADDLVKLWNTRDLAAALAANGTRVEKRELDGLGHIGIVLAISRPFRWRADVLDEMVAFVDSLPARVSASTSAGAAR